MPIVLAAAIAGAWIGTHRPQAATISSPAREAMVGVDRTPVRSVPPPRLLFDDSAVTHTFSPALTAAAAIVVDTGTGRVIWSLRPHQHRRIASLTKIMTALLALRALGPHDLVTVDKTVPRVPLVREGLRAGERVQAWKLLYSMLLYSGNDDALALAIAAGGDKWTFVQEMNDEAARLGLHDTHFISPSGVVDRDNYSSAWDVAALARVALRNDRFRAIVRTKIKRVSWAAPTYAKIYVNNNLMLGRYPGADGVKTGYTHRSGPCLVVSATRRGRTLLAVLLDDSNMYGDATRLLNFGFRH